MDFQLPPEEELLEEFKSGSIPRSKTWQILVHGLYMNKDQVAEIEEWYNIILGLSEQNLAIHAKIQVKHDKIEIWHGDVNLWQKQVSVEKDIAVESSASAKASEQAALKYSNLSKSWATEKENNPVEDNEFSSLHWAKVSERIASTITNGMYFAGSWNLSDGFPPDPETPLVPWYRLVGSDVSSLSGKNDKLLKLAEQSNKGDQLIWDPIKKEWFTLDTTDKVWSVNGKVGSVYLTPKDIGALAVDGNNTTNGNFTIRNGDKYQFFNVFRGNVEARFGNGITAATMSCMEDGDEVGVLTLKETLRVREKADGKNRRVYHQGFKPEPAEIGAEPTLTADRKRKITISTSDPSGGNDGDIWFKV